MQLLQNPKLKFQNFESKMQNPKSRLGELQMKNGYVSIQNSKSKIRPNSLDLGFWIGKFSTLDFEIWVAPNKLGNSVPVAQSEARAALSRAGRSATLRGQGLRATSSGPLVKPKFDRAACRGAFGSSYRGATTVCDPQKQKNMPKEYLNSNDMGHCLQTGFLWVRRVNTCNFHPSKIKRSM